MASLNFCLFKLWRLSRRKEKTGRVKLSWRKEILDIHVTDQDVGILRAQWGGQVIASPYKSNS